MEPVQASATAGGEVRQISRLAGPVVLGQLAWMGLGVTDLVMVGNLLGKDELGWRAIGRRYAGRLKRMLRAGPRVTRGGGSEMVRSPLSTTRPGPGGRELRDYDE